MSAAVDSDAIGLWMGGSFSPPTLAHVAAMKAAAEKLAKTYPGQPIHAFFVPVNEKYNKKSVQPGCVSTSDRLAMLKIVADHLQASAPVNITYSVSENETGAEGAVKTVDSAKAVREANGVSKLYIALGEDNLAGVLQGKWSRGDELLRDNGILYFPRGGESKNFTTASAPGINADLYALFTAGAPVRVDIDATAISSTVLRAAIRKARNAGGTVPDLSTLTLPAITEYIFANGITYGPECESGSAGGRRRKTRRIRKHRRVSRRRGSRRR